MTTRIEEARDWADTLSNQPTYEVDENTMEELSSKPTVEQLRSALIEARTQASLGLSALVSEVEAMNKDLDKLRNHRHDFSKTFSGRAEF